MKVAYVASFGTCYFNGVVRKILSQLAIWNSLPGVKAELFCRAAEGLDVPEGHIYRLKGTPTFSYDFNVVRDIQSFNPDIIYLRQELCGPQIVALLRNFPGKIVLEVNSDLDSELKLEGANVPRRRMAYYLNKITSRYLRKHLSACVCISADFQNHFPSIPHKYKIVSPNCIDLSKHPVLKPSLCARPERPSLLFVGTPNQPWHGVDMLPSLARALPECNFHIVGPGRLQNAPNNMVFHGYQSGEELSALYARSHIGIGTLALFRKNFFEASPLKVREYLAAGLPVILGYQDSAFLHQTPPWVLSLPPSEGLFEQPECVASVRNFIAHYAQYSVQHEESAPFIDAAIWERKKMQRIAEWAARRFT